MGLDNPPPKALLFDVFGTCVDWRSTVTRALTTAAADALRENTSLDDDIRQRAAQMTSEEWGDLAAAWRASYYVFTRQLASDPSLKYKTVDEHHHESLVELLSEHQLLALFSSTKITELSLIWHRLDPWSDTVAGLELLNKNFITATLSNGNLSLLNEMVDFAHMPFTHIFSTEMFQSYKPSPKVYLGAVERLGLKPEECVMVAAHLSDLKHAKKNGLRTLYVERSQEESNPELKHEGFVDVFVTEEEDGFVEAARRLGVS